MGNSGESIGYSSIFEWPCLLVLNERMDTSSNLSWAMVGLKYILIDLSLEKGLSTVATVKGIVTKIKRAL